MGDEVTLNVRMPRALKQAGDAVLQREGLSTSDAVRALYASLQQSQKVPDFLQGEEDAKARRIALRRRSLRQVVGLMPARESLSQARDERLERAWAK